jgi:hypothetical protein
MTRDKIARSTHQRLATSLPKEQNASKPITSRRQTVLLLFQLRVVIRSAVILASNVATQPSMVLKLL